MLFKYENDNSVLTISNNNIKDVSIDPKQAFCVSDNFNETSLL